MRKRAPFFSSSNGYLLIRSHNKIQNAADHSLFFQLGSTPPPPPQTPHSPPNLCASPLAFSENLKAPINITITKETLPKPLLYRTVDRLAPANPNEKERKKGKMARKRLPIFQKFSNLLRTSILVAKIRRKPIIPRLVFLKKSRRKMKIGSFELLKHSSNCNHYGFVKEYEFSASSTPLIYYGSQKNQNRFAGGYRDSIYSLLFLCRCFGGLKGERGKDSNGDYRLSMGSSLPDVSVEYYDSQAAVECGGRDEEEDSVDEKAERFIERFYQEMRLQRQRSF